MKRRNRTPSPRRSKRAVADHPDSPAGHPSPPPSSQLDLASSGVIPIASSPPASSPPETAVAPSALYSAVAVPSSSTDARTLLSKITISATFSIGVSGATTELSISSPTTAIEASFPAATDSVDTTAASAGHVPMPVTALPSTAEYTSTARSMSSTPPATLVSAPENIVDLPHAAAQSTTTPHASCTTPMVGQPTNLLPRRSIKSFDSPAYPGSDFRIRGRVVDIFRPSPNVPKAKAVFSFNLQDHTSGIRCVAFYDRATQLSEQIEKGKVYDINRVFVSPAGTRGVRWGHYWEVQLGARSAVHLADDESLPHDAAVPMTLDELAFAPDSSTVDLLGIPYGDFAAVHINGEYGPVDRRKFYLYLGGSRTVAVTIWNRLEYQPNSSRPVLVRNAKIGTYKGMRNVSISSLPEIIDDPTHKELSSRVHELDKLSSSFYQDLPMSTPLFTSKLQRITVSEALSKAPSPHDHSANSYYEIHAIFLQITSRDLTSPYCTTCKKRGDGAAFCESCNNPFQTSLNFSMSVQDLVSKDTMTISVAGDAGRSIIPHSPDSVSLDETRQVSPFHGVKFQFNCTAIAAAAGKLHFCALQIKRL